MTAPDDTPADRALTAYFKAAAPAKFPGPPAAATPRSADRPSAGTLALAASVLLLFGLGILLSQGRTPGGPKPAAGTPGLVEGSTADGARLPVKP